MQNWNRKNGGGGDGEDEASHSSEKEEERRRDGSTLGSVVSTVTINKNVWGLTDKPLELTPGQKLLFLAVPTCEEKNAIWSK